MKVGAGERGSSACYKGVKVAGRRLLRHGGGDGEDVVQRVGATREMEGLGEADDMGRAVGRLGHGDGHGRRQDGACEEDLVL